MQRRHALSALLIATTCASSVLAQRPPIARVSALATGGLLLNGNSTSLAELESAFRSIRQQNGVVWYFRENPRSDPTPEAMGVINLIVQHQLPVSMSTKPDFTDYVDENGQSKPRQR